MMTPRDYQEYAAQSVFEYFRNGGEGNPLVVMPTATGKALVNARIVQIMFENYPQSRVLVASHVEHILTQDAEAIYDLWPSAPVGIYSASIGKKQAHTPIVVGGVQSLVNNIADIGFRDCLLVDEAHLISPKDNTNYQKLYCGLKEINPNLKMIGLTATPYRLGQGIITDDGLLTDICCDQTKLDSFNWFIDEGYLTNLITPSQLATQYDISGVGMQNGDYNLHQLQEAVDVDHLTQSAIKETLEYGHNRHCWMVFTAGVEHCDHVTEYLQSYGITAVSVHSRMPKAQRKANYDGWKAGKYRAVVSNGCLTTGVDNKAVDLIVCLRHTTSASLWLQCLDMETEVLTEEGFKKYEDLTYSDSLLTFNKNNEKMETLPIDNIVCRNLEPDEYMMNLNTPQFNIRVTNGHRMLIKKRLGSSKHISEFVFTEAENLPTLQHFRIPVSCSNYSEKIIDLTNNEFWFLGIFMSDGTLDKSNNAIYIYRTDRYPEVVRHIHDCLNEMNIKYNVSIRPRPPYRTMNMFRISKGKPRKSDLNRRGWGYLEQYIDKDFPESLLDLTREQFIHLLEGLHAGDGSKQPKNVDWIQQSYHISTGNVVFANRLQIMCIKNGFKCNMYYRKDGVLLLHIKDTRYGTIVKSNDGRRSWKREEYKPEKVWCCENVNSTLIIRRGGKVAIVGNCLGRGMRVLYAPGFDLTTTEGRLAGIANGPKQNCMILDFAKNTLKNGPVNDPIRPRKKGEKPGEAPIKICPQCGVYLHCSARVCHACGYEFPKGSNLTLAASGLEIIRRAEEPLIEEFNVDRVVYTKHEKTGGTPSLKVTYHVGIHRFTEYVCLEHTSAVRNRAIGWWRKRFTSAEIPRCIDDVLKYIGVLKTPKRIRVRTNVKYPEIVGCEF